MQSTLNIWYFTDGKPGHQNQTLGLLEAMERLPGRQYAITRHQVAVLKGHGVNLLSSSGFNKIYPQLADLPTPELILATGNKTHLPAYLARRRYGRHVEQNVAKKPTILCAIMKPSIWGALFDICIVPSHDFKRPIGDHQKFWQTQGAMNRVTLVEPSLEREQKGLILIGGPSKHHAWSDLDVMGQVQSLIGKHKREMSWLITNSRRTPLETTRMLSELHMDCARFVPWEETDAIWLRKAYQLSGIIWVTADSNSMVSEALTSGAKVGLISVPQKRKNSRVIRGVNQWVEAGWLTTYTAWQQTNQMEQMDMPLQEASRIARKMYDYLTH